MRKHITLKMEGEPSSRDDGKTYFLQETDALTAEWWATRAIMLLIAGGANIENPNGGMAALAGEGFTALGKLNPMDVKPLLDEMLEWIFIIPDTRHPDNKRPINMKMGDVEEVSTLFRLRLAVFELHTGFSLPALPSTSTSAAEAATGISSATQMSRPQ